MKSDSNSGASVTSILERRQPGAAFKAANTSPVNLEHDLQLLPDMADMNARSVVEAIAKTLSAR